VAAVQFYGVVRHSSLVPEALNDALAQFLTSTKPAAERMMVAVKHRGVRRGERDQ